MTREEAKKVYEENRDRWAENNRDLIDRAFDTIKTAANNGEASISLEGGDQMLQYLRGQGYHVVRKNDSLRIIWA